MSKSPFQIPPESADVEAPVSPVRRLLSPAERFQAGEIARKTEAPKSAEFDENDDAELEPPQPTNSASFGSSPRTESDSALATGAMRKRRVRAAKFKQHSPHYHEKKPHEVAHKPIKPAPETEPQNDWDKAAQNSMARAALARKRKRVRRIVGRITLAAGVLLAVWAGATALTAPQFEIRRIDISGTERTPLAQVKKLVGKLVGQNIFRAPRSHVEAQVEAIPAVKTAALERVWSWPPHMTLRIVERTPVLQVGAGPNWWVADAQGVAFRRADRKDGGLYQLTSPQFQPQTGKPLPAAPWKRAQELEAAIDADNSLVAGQNRRAASGQILGFAPDLFR